MNVWLSRTLLPVPPGTLSGCLDRLPLLVEWLVRLDGEEARDIAAYLRHMAELPPAQLFSLAGYPTGRAFPWHCARSTATSR